MYVEEAPKAQGNHANSVNRGQKQESKPLTLDDVSALEVKMKPEARLEVRGEMRFRCVSMLPINKKGVEGNKR